VADRARLRDTGSDRSRQPDSALLGVRGPAANVGSQSPGGEAEAPPAVGRIGRRGGPANRYPAPPEPSWTGERPGPPDGPVRGRGDMTLER